MFWLHLLKDVSIQILRACMLLNCLRNQRHLQHGETSETVYLIREKLAASFDKYFLNNSEIEGTMRFVMDLKQMFAISSFINTSHILWASFCNVFSFMIFRLACALQLWKICSVVFPLEMLY